jgi:hypothetical protein
MGHGVKYSEVPLKNGIEVDYENIEKYLEDDNLAWILGSIMMDAHDILHKHIASPLWSGAMLSKELQKKYIRKYCGYKKDSAKYKKMMTYRDRHNRTHKESTSDKKSVVREYFLDMGLSPLYCSDEVGYIPAFADLLDGTEDDRIREFLDIQKPALLRESRD